MAIFKNFLGFGLTFSAYDWIIQSGPRDVMLAISIVQVVVCATSIPMCTSISPDTRLRRSYRC